MTGSRPPYPTPADGALWRVLYEGSGFSMAETHPEEDAAYAVARAAAERAAHMRLLWEPLLPAPTT
ncbi:hypothetical protein ACFWNF_15970 [Streptomyces anulatus]|uniref:hypothetical protein n=1 Tax=Streptomyces anulatus TaxID=1892 RepID=UPI0036558DA7